MHPRSDNFIYNINLAPTMFGWNMLSRSEAYTSIQNYLSSKATTQAKRLKGDIGKNNQTLLLTMDDHEEVCDEFNGVKLWWVSGKNVAKSQTLSLHNNLADEKRYYKLTFHKQHRNMVLGTYLNHVMREGKAVMVRNRQRKLYTNSGSFWNHVVFEHPATFESVAMDEELKKRIIDDLVTFSKSREFYARIGRAWKRGYLLFGPPGTGKSTMIAAMANLLGYDLYDLELTAVKDNTELRKLLIETSSKSIIVIEDIDCSLDLTGQRRKKMERAKEDEEEEEEEDQRKKKQSGLKERDVKSSQVSYIAEILQF
ncbi:AAA-ATPase ASD, mitochondrial [Arachis duranensis]|uniref:AAA-ATPase ASD, mitochondrial n=1 Tax=Arachis duranensis TaxID=130453 RepID=A0A6P4C0Z4_ARADU|nr:AAA-ATPase ASD, mitochondrial [Arachis duranensis]